MTKQGKLKDFRKAIDKVAETTRKLHNLPEKVYELADFCFPDSASPVPCFIVQKDYGKLLLLLTAVRIALDKPLELTQYYGGMGGTMHFYWKNKDIEVGFSCDHDKIPPALMPSEDCKVERNDRYEISYAIVCPAKKE